MVDGGIGTLLCIFFLYCVFTLTLLLLRCFGTLSFGCI